MLELPPLLLSPPPSISLCRAVKQGSFRTLAEMSVHRPTAQRGDSPPSPKGVMSRQATSCSISVVLVGVGGQGGGGLASYLWFILCVCAERLRYRENVSENTALVMCQLSKLCWRERGERGERERGAALYTKKGLWISERERQTRETQNDKTHGCSSTLYRQGISYCVCVCVCPPVCSSVPQVPDLFELPREDLEVVECTAHGQHHLGRVTGRHADVPALWFLPLAGQGFAVLHHQAYRARRDLGGHKNSDTHTHTHTT